MNDPRISPLLMRRGPDWWTSSTWLQRLLIIMLSPITLLDNLMGGGKNT